MSEASHLPSTKWLQHAHAAICQAYVAKALSQLDCLARSRVCLYGLCRAGLRHASPAVFEGAYAARTECVLVFALVFARSPHLPFCVTLLVQLARVGVHSYSCARGRVFGTGE